MFLRSASQFVAFEDDAAAVAAAAAAAAATGNEGEGEEETFTQDQVNTFIATERRKMQVQQQKLVVELETLKKNATLTKEEKETLEGRIEELQTQYMTAEEKARRANEQAEEKHKKQFDDLTTERDNWKNRHAKSVIDTAITRAASDNKAFYCEQISAILTPKTKLVEVLDESGKPTGEYEPKVAFPDKDKDDKPIILELTVIEAVKRMKELKQYGNLFEGTKVGGLGGTGSQTSGNTIDLAKIAREDPALYRKLRKEQPELFGR